MIDTQITHDNYSYSYDSSFDLLRLTFKNSDEFYYDEVYTNVYIRYDEDTDEVIGIQILDLNDFNVEVVKKHLVEKQLDILKSSIAELEKKEV